MLVADPTTRSAAAVAALMRPRSIAVIGASEDQKKYGGRMMKNLITHGYQGEILPINPGRAQLFGVPAYADIAATRVVPDVAIMAIPQDKVLETVQACAARGIKGAIVITAKFSDAGPEGAALEAQVVAAAGSMRLVGPNCLGIISQAHHTVLTPSTALADAGLPVGRIGFVSQSGALMGTIFDKAKDTGIAFSHAISVGNQADLEMCDFVEYLIDDPATSVICTYIEGLKDPARFAALARRARMAGKPWLAVSSGRTAAGAAASFSHTASIAGNRAVFEAVCREEHVSLLHHPITMMLLASGLAEHPKARVERVAVLTPSGGEAALAADEVESAGLEMAKFSERTRSEMCETFMPTQAHNPVDYGGRRLGDGPDVAKVSADIVSRDENTDALLFAVTTYPTLATLAQNMVEGMAATPGSNLPRKPAVYAIELGSLADGVRRALVERGRCFTNNLREAVDVLAAWKARSRFADPAEPVRPASCPQAAAGTGPATLGEDASKQLMAGYGIPVNLSRLAASADEAAAQAAALGFPVVMKIVSPDIVHKSDVGGVVVGLQDAAQVHAAFERMLATVRGKLPDARIEGVSVQNQFQGRLELIVGARRDPDFGPVVVFGAGGVLVDLLAARCIMRAPMAAADVRRQLKALPIWPVLAGFRGAALDVDAVVDAIVRVGWLAQDLAHDPAAGDFELDINPLIVAQQGCCAVDARVRIGEAQPPKD